MTSDLAAILVVDRGMLGKIFFGILGFIYAIIVYRIPASIAASVISEIGNVALMKTSMVIEFAVGLSFSVIAYTTAWGRSFKLGMRAWYGLVVGLVFATGMYTILTSV